MAESKPGKLNRRTLLKGSAAVAALGAASWAAGSYFLGGSSRVSRAKGKKVIVIGIDGMDPKLCAKMMANGDLPNLTKLSAQGGFSPLLTSVPPQSPVAWANFINGAGPGSHGIFDFMHRHLETPHEPFFAASDTMQGSGYWNVGDYKLQLDFWPFSHKPPATVLQRQGVPFWDYLDKEGIPSTFYDLPSNYPPSPSHYGHHRCISGMGTPDMMGQYGVYQYFAEDIPEEPRYEPSSRRVGLAFKNESAKTTIEGPTNTFLRRPEPVQIDLIIHRDRQANTAAIELSDHKLLLKPGQWSQWVKVDFTLENPAFVPDSHAGGICRFYLQEVAPNFRLYVSPINIDPSAPAMKISEPDSFIQTVSKNTKFPFPDGLFATTGFQEEYNARKEGIFDDDEFRKQATMVMEDRLKLWEYALDDYDDGLLFFYFSSSDLQSHIFWWDSDDPHPIREPAEAKKANDFVLALYKRLDAEIGRLVDMYGKKATIMVMSDHGFGNFGRQFHLNKWLRYYQYLGPAECMTLKDADWSKTYAYGMGINGLYLNLKDREPHGIIDPSDKEKWLKRLVEELEPLTDTDRNGARIINKVYRADEIYKGDATNGDAMKLAPDLIVGYARGYRASWETCGGNMAGDPTEVIYDNNNAWSADHCVDAMEVPGIFYCNKKFDPATKPALIDIAPAILEEFGVKTHPTMTGKNFFST